MLVCLCNALSDKQIRACAGQCSVSEVYRQCGCRPQCGKCAGTIRDILREHQQPANAGGVFMEGAAAHPPNEG